jgi:hypothetical protein
VGERRCRCRRGDVVTKKEISLWGRRCRHEEGDVAGGEEMLQE